MPNPFLPERLLILRQHWLQRVLSGEKTWELRSTRTLVRGRIGLAASGTGMMFGEVDLDDCIGPLDRATLLDSQHRHRASAEDVNMLGYKRCFAWVLGQPLSYPQPIPYQHPKGAVIWVRIPA